MSTVVLVLVVVTALAFDFTNGFHDTGNAMAASIATGALKPKVAVALSGVLNLAGAFLSLSVAATIASGLVETRLVTLTVVFAGLAGGILWNLVTWMIGIPSSSSHALIGGVVGAAIAANGFGAVQWHGVVSKVIIPAVLSPLIAISVAAIGTWAIYRATRGVGDQERRRGFRYGQIGTSSLLSLAHGSNDAQKTMGVITLALVANGTLHPGAQAPTWVIASCAVAISLGTYVGGWRIIRTMGRGLLELESPQGFAAEASSAATILLSTHYGYSLSTTHVATGSILGSGVGRRGALVRWSTARRMVVAWLVTLPTAALVGVGAYALATSVGDDIGVLVDFVLLSVALVSLYVRSRRAPVTAANVNDDWDRPPAAGSEPRDRVPLAA